MIQFPIIKDLDELVDLRIKDLKMFSKYKIEEKTI